MPKSNKAKEFVKKMDKLRNKKPGEVDYVEVLENILISEEPLDTLVRLPFGQLINVGLDKLLQNLSVLAIGTDDDGQFKIDKLGVELAGVVDQDIVFRVTGTLQKYKVEHKKLPAIKKSKKKKKAS